MAPPLTVVDVFSGIGGIGFALQGITKSVLYCERDVPCQHVLLARMHDGCLDSAPIHSDIRNLHIPNEWGVKMIAGGFPCQDISSIGLQRGIQDGERSTLFYQMIRIVEESSTIEAIFLENVANIIKCGLKEVLIECCVKLGFDLQWVVLAAGELGAPHARNRWFALACKKSFRFEDYDISLDGAEHIPRWDNEPGHRFTFKPSTREDTTWDPRWSRRCGMLGNAAVPAVVREAFVELMQNKKNWSLLATALAEYKVPLASLETFPDHGLVVDGFMIHMPPKISRLPADKHSVVCHITQGSSEPTVMNNLPTPRHGNTHASSVTVRSAKDLPTILTNCDETIEIIKSAGIEYEVGKLNKIIVPNVNYVEWMMGFPADWTKFEEDSAVKIEEEDSLPEENPVVVAQAKPKASWMNGFHVLIKEHPGKDIKFISSIWRNLSVEEKQQYRNRIGDYM